MELLDLSSTPPTPVPPSYFYPINGDGAREPPRCSSALNVPPRGSNDPILLKAAPPARRYFGDVAQIEVSPTPPTASFPCRRPRPPGLRSPLHGHERPERHLLASLRGTAACSAVGRNLCGRGSFAVTFIASNGAGADAETHVLTVTGSAIVVNVPEERRAFDVVERPASAADGRRARRERAAVAPRPVARRIARGDSVPPFPGCLGSSGPGAPPFGRPRPGCHFRPQGLRPARQLHPGARFHRPRDRVRHGAAQTRHP